jgi:hypothetical protein
MVRFSPSTRGSLRLKVPIEMVALASLIAALHYWSLLEHLTSLRVSGGPVFLP